MRVFPRSVMALFVAATLVPSLIVLGIYTAGIFAHERAMRTVARTYVQDLAENVALRYKKSFTQGGIVSNFFPMDNTFARFSLDSFRTPGWVALISEKGEILTATYGMEALEKILPKSLPLGEAQELKGNKGEVFTVAVYPAGNTSWYVLAVVSWEHLLGPMNRFGLLWGFMVIFLGAINLMGALLLWKSLVSPLRNMEHEMSSLNWGEDSPQLCNTASVHEICRLRKVFFKLAQTAMEKRRLMEKSVSDMLKIQEAERTRLAREIHDGPLQDVTALIQQIHLFKLEVSTGEQDQRLAIAEEGAHHVVRDLRSMCDTLSPPWIDLGLFQALTELSERLSLQTGVQISLDFLPEEENIPEDLVLALFRIFQEGVSNAVKHGRAQFIRARWYKEESRYFFEIEDDGIGFNPPQELAHLRSEGHRGLVNIAERVKLMGGVFLIHSEIGLGTRIVCSFDPQHWHDSR